MSPVIVLNGCSSAGKSTLAQMLQQCLPEPYQHLSLDQFRDGLPSRTRGLNAPAGSEGERGLNVVPRADTEDSLTAIEFGDFGEAVLTQMRETAARFAAAGIPVIVDDLLLKPSYLEDYVHALDPARTWLVGVRCPLDLVEARERSRIGRFPGTAREHYVRVHAHISAYDVEVDTGELTPRRCAEKVMDRLQTPPQALRALRADRDPQRAQ